MATPEDTWDGWFDDETSELTDDELATDPLLTHAAAWAASYSVGARPGLDSLDIVTALYSGLSSRQLDAVAHDQGLQALVRKVWDAHGVSHAVRDLAATDTDSGRRHAQLLAHLGHDADPSWLAALIAAAERLLLDSAPQAIATKGALTPDTQRWTLESSFSGGRVLVELTDGGYRVSFVPEIDRGACLLIAHWTGQDAVERHPVTLTARQPVVVTVASHGRKLEGVTLISVAGNEATA